MLHQHDHHYLFESSIRRHIFVITDMRLVGEEKHRYLCGGEGDEDQTKGTTQMNGFMN
jgi:hypothetical protein